jgi:uncharacterized protein with HEPN domain
MPRGSELYLNDIHTAVQTIERFTSGLDESAFTTDEIRLHGTLYNLIVIGEAVKNLPDEVQAKVPAVPWRDIQRFRDKLVHHYFSIKPSVVWQVIQEDLPVLKTAIEQLLQEIKDNDDGQVES